MWQRTWSLLFGEISAKYRLFGGVSLGLSALTAKRCGKLLISFKSHSLSCAFNIFKMLHSFIGIYIYANICSGISHDTTGISFQQNALLSWANSWLFSPTMTSSGSKPSLCSLHSPSTPRQSEPLYPNAWVSWLILLPFKPPLQSPLARR